MTMNLTSSYLLYSSVYNDREVYERNTLANVNIEGIAVAETGRALKNDLVNWLEDQGYKFGLESKIEDGNVFASANNVMFKLKEYVAIKRDEKVWMSK